MTYIKDTSAAESLTVNLNGVGNYPNPHFMTDAGAKKLAQKILGLASFSIPYLFTKNQVKIAKSNKKKKELNIVMHLSPSNLSGYQTCPKASHGCRSACLNISGKGTLSGCQIGRIKKTKFFFEHRQLFKKIMIIELNYWLRKANEKNMKLAVRLNGTSDIQWEKVFPELFSLFSSVQFYDYTKIEKRFLSSMPHNYHLTFSKTEENDDAVKLVMKNGGNVAMVFSDFDSVVGKRYKGRRVVDGVNSDRRYADPKGCIVGLQALGLAKHDDTGFVVKN